MALYVDHDDEQTDDFEWSLKGRLRVIDHGATLVGQSKFQEYMETNAFEVIAFDPASSVKDTTHLQSLDHVQLVQHAKLGDGQATTLKTCMAPAMTSTLEPLDAEHSSRVADNDAQVLARLPIASIALDQTDDVTSADWLLLDHLNDNIAVLDHSVQTLANALLFHVHVPVMATHYDQTSLADICRWMTDHDFQFYRVNRLATFSHLPANERLLKRQATQASDMEVVFTPGEQRLATYTQEQLTKLAFLLDTVYSIHDYSYQLLRRIDPARARQYLIARGYVSAYDRKPEETDNTKTDDLATDGK